MENSTARRQNGMDWNVFGMHSGGALERITMSNVNVEYVNTDFF
jgi:hypothetical protein